MLGNTPTRNRAIPIWSDAAFTKPTVSSLVFKVSWVFCVGWLRLRFYYIWSCVRWFASRGRQKSFIKTIALRSAIRRRTGKRHDELGKKNKNKAIRFCCCWNVLTIEGRIIGSGMIRTSNWTVIWRPLMMRFLSNCPVFRPPGLRPELLIVIVFIRAEPKVIKWMGKKLKGKDNQREDGREGSSVHAFVRSFSYYYYYYLLLWLLSLLLLLLLFLLLLLHYCIIQYCS